MKTVFILIVSVFLVSPTFASGIGPGEVCNKFLDLEFEDGGYHIVTIYVLNSLRAADMDIYADLLEKQINDNGLPFDPDHCKRIADIEKNCVVEGKIKQDTSCDSMQRYVFFKDVSE